MATAEFPRSMRTLIFGRCAEFCKGGFRWLAVVEIASLHLEKENKACLNAMIDLYFKIKEFKSASGKLYQYFSGNLSRS